MIRTKYFSDCGYDEIDSLINEWLGKNPEIRVIDIKYQYVVTDTSEYSSALMIYRRKESND